MKIINQRSFTLVEILVVLALIAILATILIVIIKPNEIFKKSRDTKRINDLQNIDKAFNIIYSIDSTFNELNYFSSNIVYLSLKDSSSTCGSWLSQLPPLSSGWQYRCSATPTDANGQGWLPLNFSQYPALNLSQLPVDPKNEPPYYYTFVVGGSYELTATLESDTNISINGIADKDGGTSLTAYEVGSNLKLTPSLVENRNNKDPSLVGYWSFDEGTGTIAYDYSGNGNNGTLYSSLTICSNPPTSGCPQWTTGKVGGALNFDGNNDYISIPDSSSLKLATSVTIALWFKMADYPPPPPPGGYDWYNFVNKGRYTDSYGLMYYRGGSLGSFTFYLKGVTPATVSFSFTPSLNQWYFIVCTWDGNNAKIFLDGVQKTSVPTTGNLYISTNQLRISLDTGNTYPFNGTIDEVRIYNRALSGEEIQALYNATK
jgi:prepilin-type N-terminal cleavage/methylation domain-containing protein